MAVMTQITGQQLYAIVQRHKAAGERLYGIADAARDSALALAPRDEFNRPIYSLFDGDAPDFMHDVAPYLFSFDWRPTYPYRGSELLDRWAAALGNSVGVLALSEANSNDLLLHLRHLFRVTDEQRRAFYFRFYDPRVLRAFLPTCAPADASGFFGPIRRVFVEAEQPGAMLSCAPDRPGVKMEEVSLLPAPGA